MGAAARTFHMTIGKRLEFQRVFAVFAFSWAGLLQLKAHGEPDIQDRVDKFVHHLAIMMRSGGNSKPLFTSSTVG
jgi:hypothetical protein